jgi:hypothetical protein
VSSLERLVELARREEEAVESRRWEELLAIQDEQLELLAAVRGTLTAEARPVLELALARSLATEKALFGSLAETQGIIERLRAGRRAIGAYRSSRRRGGVEIRA